MAALRVCFCARFCISYRNMAYHVFSRMRSADRYWCRCCLSRQVLGVITGFPLRQRSFPFLHGATQRSPLDFQTGRACGGKAPAVSLHSAPGPARNTIAGVGTKHCHDRLCVVPGDLLSGSLLSGATTQKDGNQAKDDSIVTAWAHSMALAASLETQIRCGVVMPGSQSP